GECAGPAGTPAGTEERDVAQPGAVPADPGAYRARQVPEPDRRADDHQRIVGGIALARLQQGVEPARRLEDRARIADRPAAADAVADLLDVAAAGFGDLHRHLARVAGARVVGQQDRVLHVGLHRRAQRVARAG